MKQKTKIEDREEILNKVQDILYDEYSKVLERKTFLEDLKEMISRI